MPAFFFTDIEESTRLWEQHPQVMAEALRLHDAILYESVAERGGRVIENRGDGIYAVFEEGNPLLAAIDAQRRLMAEDWGAIGAIKVRIGINAVDANREGIDYFLEGNYRGPGVNEAARVTGIAWGGQILATANVLQQYPIPADTTVLYMGAHMLRSLVELRHIYSIRHPDLPQQTFPPLRSLSVRPNNLPLQDTTFLGRDEELKEIATCLQKPDCRLLILAGTGGVGKTRLAIQAAAEAVVNFSNGVFFVPLASIRTPEFIISTIANAIDFSFYSGSNQKLQLFNYLREKELLLVLDNAEHVLDGMHVVQEILAAAPRVKIIITSREWLNMKGEQRLKITGMEVPLAGGSYSLHELKAYSAIQLFMQAARRARADFELTLDNQYAVIRICRLVAGMPLGIELAAAWIFAFSCEEIADKIEQNLQFLMTEKPHVPQRQRSLYAVCDYFWSHLAAREQSILRELSLFPDSFTADAAREVNGASFFFLSALLDRAYLHKTTVDGPQPIVRYEVHEVLRHYAQEQMAAHPDERARALARHAHFFASFLEEQEAALKDDRQEEALARIRQEIENVRMAWDWAVAEQHIPTLKQACQALFLAYDLLCWYEEGSDMFRRASDALETAVGDECEVLQARLRAREAFFYQRISHPARSEELLAQSLVIAQHANQQDDIAFCLHYLGVSARITGRFDLAVERLEGSINLYRALDKPWELALVLSHLADTVYRLGRHDEAHDRIWESYVIRQKLGEPRSLASTMVYLGVFLNALGERRRARVLLEEGLGKHQSIANNDWSTGTALLNLGVVAFDSGEYEDACDYYQRSLSIFRDLGNDWTIAAALDNLGQTALKLGEHGQAATYFREALEVAHAGQVIPIALDVLVGVAHLLAMGNQTVRACALLYFVLAHPSIDRAETEMRARNLYEELADRLLPEEAKAHTYESSALEDVTDDVLAYLVEVCRQPSLLLY